MYLVIFGYFGGLGMLNVLFSFFFSYKLRVAPSSPYAISAYKRFHMNVLLLNSGGNLYFIALHLIFTRESGDLKEKKRQTDWVTVG